MQYIKTKNLTQKKQVLCGLRGIFLLFSCQTPEQQEEKLEQQKEKIKRQEEEIERLRSLLAARDDHKNENH